MRRLLAPLTLGLAIVGAAAAAAPPIGGAPDSATAVAKPSAAAARPSAMFLRLHYEMLCAQPGRGPVVVTLPQAVHVPARISRTAVQVDGKTPPSVALAGRTVTIGLEPVPRVICQAFVPGILRITFTHAAKLGNPLRAGTYSVRASVGTHSFVARLQIGR